MHMDSILTQWYHIASRMNELARVTWNKKDKPHCDNDD